MKKLRALMRTALLMKTNTYIVSHSAGYYMFSTLMTYIISILYY